jgi:hypothetical protein
LPFATISLLYKKFHIFKKHHLKKPPPGGVVAAALSPHETKNAALSLLPVAPKTPQETAGL